MESGLNTSPLGINLSVELKHYLQELNALYTDYERGAGIRVSAQEKHSAPSSGESLTQFAV